MRHPDDVVSSHFSPLVCWFNQRLDLWRNLRHRRPSNPPAVLVAGELACAADASAIQQLHLGAGWAGADRLPEVIRVYGRLVIRAHAAHRSELW